MVEKSSLYQNVIIQFTTSADRRDFEDVNRKLHRRMMQVYDLVPTTVREYDVDWRTTAYIVALRRLEMVNKERGFPPLRNFKNGPE